MPSDETFDRRLHTAVLAAYDGATLSMLVGLDMGVALPNVVAPDGFAKVAFDFLAWCRQENRLGELLDLAVADKPHRHDFAILRDELLAASAAPGALPRSEIDAAVAGFRGRFKERQDWLRYLRAYKRLHDLLHDLGDFLGNLRAEHEARRATGAAVSATTEGFLRKQTADADRWWGRTELPGHPPLWVGQLATATEEFLGADAARHNRALARLASLPPANLLPLNTEMVRCARRLEPEELLADLDTVARLVGPSPAVELKELAVAVARLRESCGGLANAIRHDTRCQHIDTELRAAQGLPWKSPDAILGWDVVQAEVAALGDELPGEPRAAAVVAALEAFAAAPSAATFDRLVEAFEVLFKAADRTLLNVTGELVDDATGLTATLEDRP